MLYTCCSVDRNNYLLHNTVIDTVSDFFLFLMTKKMTEKMG